MIATLLKEKDRSHRTAAIAKATPCTQFQENFVFVSELYECALRASSHEAEVFL